MKKYILTALLALFSSIWPLLADPLDTISFGDSASEQGHDLQADHSDVVTGGLGESARRLLPLDTPSWEGGKLSFTMKVDPAKQNYVTARFWGSDVTENRLVLYVEGKQIGWFHLGDVEVLDAGNDDGSPAYNDRFFYNTSPLPLSLTQGKQEVQMEIRSMGRIWGYGSTWEQYQKNMTDPARGLYRLYTHTEPCFVPPKSEKQGEAKLSPPVRTSPGPEVLDELKERENQEIDHLVDSAKPLDEIQMQFLARAYHVKWCHAYQKPEVVQKVVEGLDNLYSLWKNDPKVLDNAPGAYNGGWLRFGPTGDAVKLLAEPLQPLLDQNNSFGVSHRAAWSEMLQASRDEARKNRRLYSNQTMIVDLNAYRANRGLEAIDPSHALPENQMLDYLYQSIGIKPWLGSDTPTGPEKPMGDNYWQLTAKGLTKELGYVGYYGEVIDWVGAIYEATCPVLTDGFGPGDEKIKQQLIKVAKARAIFRYPMLDAEGNRAMRIEAVIGWRDEGHYPGNIAYAERQSWDGSSLYTPALTMDPSLVGYVQQMFADNQFFYGLEEHMKEKGLRVTVGLLSVPDQYDALKAQKPVGTSLPMNWDQPNFAWADEDDGVVAVKHGHDIFYASLYWRARNAINFLARIHDTSPTFDRIAVVHEDTEFESSGFQYTRPDWINMAFGNGGIKYPGDLHSAVAGEKLPIAKIPDGVTFKPGDESPYAGRGSFYRLLYGKYLIGMNATEDKTKELKIPEGFTNAPELISGKTVDLKSGAIQVPPRSTMIFYLNK